MAKLIIGIYIICTIYAPLELSRFILECQHLNIDYYTRTTTRMELCWLWIMWLIGLLLVTLAIEAVKSKSSLTKSSLNDKL